MCARAYDKTAEQADKGTDFWLDIWGERFDPGQPVHRVEFEFGRQGLREFGVDTPREAVEGAGALWASVTEDWLTYRCPTDDDNRSRWPIAPEWRDVQRAAVRSRAHGVERMYEGRRKGDLRKLTPVLNGCLASFAALVGTDGIQQSCAALPPFLRDYEVRTGVESVDRVAEKARERLVS